MKEWENSAYPGASINGNNGIEPLQIGARCSIGTSVGSTYSRGFTSVGDWSGDPVVLMDLPEETEYTDGIPENEKSYTCTFGFSQKITPSQISIPEPDRIELINNIKSHQNNPLSYSPWSQSAETIANSDQTYTIYEGTNSAGTVEIVEGEKIEFSKLNADKTKTSTGSGTRLTNFPTREDFPAGSPGDPRNPLG